MSQLDKISEKFRTDSIARNSYTDKGGYSSMAPNAISDGDEKGKGENVGKIGSFSDIQNRTSSIARNTYNDKNGYGVNHPNAISDGDDKGKGEGAVANGLKIGGKADIKARKDLLAKNTYKVNKGYDSNNKNALSDGDDKGKGENKEQIGSMTDIKARMDNLGRNTNYSKENPYGRGSKNALSDGDNKGKGQIGDTGTIGSLIDINSRIDLIKSNTYGVKKSYPDFKR
jgi:hypothetical protein